MESNFKKYAIIVAGGKGSRMENDLPKQLLLLNNKPVILYSLQRFINYDSEIILIVVIHESLRDRFKELLIQHNFKHPIQLVNGGETRFHSVKQGLDCITGEGVVGIHDAARPLVSFDTISRSYNTAFEKGNAVPSIKVTESLRVTDLDSNAAVDRNAFRVIQTPQCFKVSLIKKAFEVNYSLSFTDDATVLEFSGEKINLVEGNPENIKITLPLDLTIAEALMTINKK